MLAEKSRGRQAEDPRLAFQEKKKASG